MNDRIFPCRDCEVAFYSAEDFVSHISRCVPVASTGVLLQNAATLLRRWVHQGQRRFVHNSGVKLTHQTEDWLNLNGLLGSVLK